MGLIVSHKPAKKNSFWAGKSSIVKFFLSTVCHFGLTVAVKRPKL